MCERLYSLSVARRGLALGDALVDLARRHVDARQHVALAQHLQRHFLADVLAVAAVVDALLLERGRQVAELDVVALGDLGQRLVEHFVGDLDAEAVGALHLHFLQHEALEHLLAQHVARRQLLPALLDALRDDLRLRVERRCAARCRR